MSELIDRETRDKKTTGTMPSSIVLVLDLTRLMNIYIYVYWKYYFIVADYFATTHQRGRGWGDVRKHHMIFGGRYLLYVEVCVGEYMLSVIGSDLLLLVIQREPNNNPQNNL